MISGKTSILKKNLDDSNTSDETLFFNNSLKIYRIENPSDYYGNEKKSNNAQIKENDQILNQNFMKEKPKNLFLIEEDEIKKLEGNFIFFF